MYVAGRTPAAAPRRLGRENVSAGDKLNERAVPDLRAVEVAAMVDGARPVLVPEMLLRRLLSKLMMGGVEAACMRRNGGEGGRRRHQNQQEPPQHHAHDPSAFPRTARDMALQATLDQALSRLKES